LKVKQTPTAERATQGKQPRWLNRNIFAFGMASLFSDMGHETATALLPAFLALLGAPPFALGVIEGVADSLSSLVKLFMGWYSDRIGKRKFLLVLGYVATGIGKPAFAFATMWWHVLVLRAFSWMGRGTRGPLRDAMMTESVSPDAYGRAFGFERTMDTLGAIIGPAVASLLLACHVPLRTALLLTFFPGMLAAVAVVGLVREPIRSANHNLKFFTSLKQLPRAFKSYVGCVGIFGLGNFAHTLLILRAIELLTGPMGKAHASAVAVLLYTVHNIVYAAVSYPVGALSDRIGKRGLLGLGYVLFGLMCCGFAIPTHSVIALGALFILAGVYIGIIDAMERAMAADLLPEELRGTGFGVLATVNGVGDLVSSVVVGALWTSVSPVAGFGYAATLAITGGVALLRLRR